ncbi:hypothetical protein LUZ60_004115 [Juncus effusus]|nr:hypothetical protein LUZ60_004115 [Juncus effusus]
MGKKAREERVELVRAVVGEEYSEMDIIRALHMANDDPAAAINIIFDTPRLHLRPSPSPSPSPTPPSNNNNNNNHPRPASPSPAPTPSNYNNSRNEADDDSKDKDEQKKSKSTPPFHESALEVKREKDLDRRAKDEDEEVSTSSSSEWWLIGEADISGMSTCKGRVLQSGENLTFSFPPFQQGVLKGRSRSLSSCSEIVRFSTAQHGEIGRIPNEWARCLLPLIRRGKIMLQGYCKSASGILSIMDTITLTISVHINVKMLQSAKQASFKTTGASTEEVTFHPLPALFRLLGLVPFKKAEFTPEDLYSRKRPAGSLVGLTSEKCRKTSFGCENEGEGEGDEEAISDSDLDKMIGTTETSQLQEMEPGEAVECELRPYQKQALAWMVALEKEKGGSSSHTTLHPCWDAYRLSDPRGLVVYLNSFSGDASTEFPSTLQIARGGILADAMGLGKTIMTIALLLSSSGKASPSTPFQEPPSLSPSSSSCSSKKSTSPSVFTKLLRKPKTSTSARVGGGSLIVCPMTLLGQWKAEIESHVKAGTVSVYTHYGQSRGKDAAFLAQSDIVLTTYGVLSSEFSSEDDGEKGGGLYSVEWFRVVLDEAHVIKSTKSQISLAAAALSADRRWCLTGTPIQNNLQDLYSLLRFLRIEPWSNCALWNKLIQKPYEEGDERGLKLVQSILKPIMLRRTKSSTDKQGRPILTLPPANTQVIYCELSEAEKDFYEALFKRSKVKFDEFVEQGKVLHNYASILELLLRLRQCCDHPFLVLSRGDTEAYADLNKLAKRLAKGGGASTSTKSKEAYINSVVEDLSKGELSKGECPICLEAFEDAVLTPCAHRLCRECLLATWRSSSSSASSGLCPVCRQIVNKQELITAPANSRFRVDVKANWVESSKVSFLLKELRIIRESSSPAAKSIVFSQWTAFLDLLEIPLSKHNIAYLRLDGTMTLQQREKVIKDFGEDNSILVLLMSLKAGGVGINLTAASNAFLMDPWWNPAVEEQAVMRIHRIGQTKEVSIKRFIVKGTVEERMEAVQARKQRMISGALTDQQVRTARLEELKMLFS